MFYYFQWSTLAFVQAGLPKTVPKVNTGLKKRLYQCVIAVLKTFYCLN